MASTHLTNPVFQTMCHLPIPLRPSYLALSKLSYPLSPLKTPFTLHTGQSTHRIDKAPVQLAALGALLKAHARQLRKLAAVVLQVKSSWREGGSSSRGEALGGREA